MLFNSVAFLFAFLPIAFAVFWALRSRQARYVWLTLTGYAFYAYWDPRFCLLMAFTTLLSWGAGLGFLRWSDPARRRLCLLVPVTVDLLVLGLFKYADFGLSTVSLVVGWLGGSVGVTPLGLVLPVGLSFYTFHTITYIVDSWRGVVTPTRNLFEYASYVSLFSQLVAGPIIRFREVQRDLATIGHDPRARWIRRGVSFLVIGLVEKVLVADSLAAFVDPALAEYRSLSTAGAWLAMTGYSFQLYFDFSGYSTMAVGLGLLFGIRIPQNFNSPYQALDPSDFWRRWHISLSRCLRDYLYIPLGGSRRGPGRTTVNLLVTMLLGGLWHGAAWTFVAWGAWHGILLVAYRRYRARWDRLPVILRQAAMFLLVTLGWVLFRSSDFPMALHLFRTMAGAGSTVPASLPGLAIAAVAAAGAWAMAGRNPFQWRHRWSPLGWALIALAFGACLAVISSGRPSPFLYFQF